MNTRQQPHAFSPQELEEIRDLFGALPEHLEEETFKKALRDLRVKYHPDNFEKFGDETVRQMATDRFQRIERLGEKLEAWFKGALPVNPSVPGQEVASRRPETEFGADARFAYQQMKIEIRTHDKDLKYHLFGTFYRWLTLGERFKIPETKAWLIADEQHSGRSIGFQETIRLYLTFEEDDSVETIVNWLYGKLAGRAETLLIEGEMLPINYEELLYAVKRRSVRWLNAA